MSDKKIDEVTGVETTGHEWDGITELNTPLPRWWLWSFYACIVCGVAILILYPGVPTLTGYTKGVLGFSQRAAVEAELKAGREAQSKFRKAIGATPLAAIKTKPDLLRFAMAGGRAAFGENCAPCHGRGAQGSVGYPNLADDNWLWGGSIAAIHQTIQYGVRWSHDETRVSDMPKYGLEKLLEPSQISDVAEYVMSLSGKPSDAAGAKKGKVIFAEQCSACHGENGKGNADVGAPNLTDRIWLYGSDKASIITSIETGRGGRMPNWAGRLDPITVKSLAVYVHSLGGGK